ncbi:DNA topoisomerase-1 [Sphingomonas jejuensis]|uniref:DNA topoisomerase-1 n=1 Tax=Sphingomonas jejuensis TaxID=904715 RepID=A0ABX0XN84_9SPHN|nr:DNA topoisomerase-1 [Sphingomonas jejuensis]
MAGGLTFVDDDLPGITRKKAGKGWAYFTATGERIKDRDEIDRLNRIGLPPAYKDAWFCPSPDGHIQAVGWDDKGRKQYRYHLDFRAQQEAAKYDRCALFGRKLPLLRARVESDLAGRGLGRERAVAAVVRLLDVGHVRVGNASYAKTNKSYGATTLTKKHAVLKGRTLKLEYRAKSGKQRVLTVSDGGLNRFVKKMQDLPGQNLFNWLDDDGTIHPVTSTDVNCYIREAMGEDFTAKHFRTWGASAIAFETLFETAGSLTLKQLLEPVTEALGNTPAIARKSYVHPALIALTAKGVEWDASMRLPRGTRYLTRAERGLIGFLEEAGKVPVQAAA